MSNCVQGQLTCIFFLVSFRTELNFSSWRPCWFCPDGTRILRHTRPLISRVFVRKSLRYILKNWIFHPIKSSMLSRLAKASKNSL